MSKPSVILLGSKPGSVAALSVMLERGWDVRGVVYSAKYDYPWISGPTLGQFASEKGIKLFPAQSHLTSDDRADFIVSYMYRFLVKTETLSLANRAALNFHAGPLPEFGGWAFYNMAILENSSYYGCSCHYMDDNFDTGPLLRVRRFPIKASEETAYSLEQKTQEEMVKLFCEFCTIAESSKELPCREQDKQKIRYLNREAFEKLKEIPFDSDDETVDRYARAFWYPPYDCAYVRYGNVKIEVIPQIVKKNMAELLHAEDMAKILTIARQNGRQISGNHLPST